MEAPYDPGGPDAAVTYYLIVHPSWSCTLEEEGYLATAPYCLTTAEAGRYERLLGLLDLGWGHERGHLVEAGGGSAQRPARLASEPAPNGSSTAPAESTPGQSRGGHKEAPPTQAGQVQQGGESTVG